MSPDLIEQSVCSQMFLIQFQPPMFATWQWISVRWPWKQATIFVTDADVLSNLYDADAAVVFGLTNISLPGSVVQPNGDAKSANHQTIGSFASRPACEVCEIDLNAVTNAILKARDRNGMPAVTVLPNTGALLNYASKEWSIFSTY
jgi:hypothetical protein